MFDPGPGAGDGTPVGDEGIRVLHVDDDPEYTALVSAFLEREHDAIEVETAHDAGEGLDALESTAIDCVVSDHDMPGRNGIEFLEAVRETRPDVPFILFTGKGSEEVASDAVSAGVSDYLQKGTGTDQYTLLANRIENAVRQFRAERRSAEHRRRLEARSAAMEASIDGMAILDDEGIYRYVNEAHADVYGYDREAFAGETWRLCYGDEELERFESEVMPSLFQRGSWRGEATGRRSDGSAFRQELSLTTIDDGGIVCVVRDISGATEREQALRETTRLLEAVLETTTAAIFVKDLEGRYVLANEECEALLDADADTVVGVTDRDLFADERADRLRREDRRVVESGETVEFELEFSVAGESRTYLTLKSPVYDESGDPWGVCGVATDVTAFRERELASDEDTDDSGHAADSGDRD